MLQRQVEKGALGMVEFFEMGIRERTRRILPYVCKWALAFNEGEGDFIWVVPLVWRTWGGGDSLKIGVSQPVN